MVGFVSGKRRAVDWFCCLFAERSGGYWNFYLVHALGPFASDERINLHSLSKGSRKVAGQCSAVAVMPAWRGNKSNRQKRCRKGNACKHQVRAEQALLMYADGFRP